MKKKTETKCVELLKKKNKFKDMTDEVLLKLVYAVKENIDNYDLPESVSKYIEEFDIEKMFEYDEESGEWESY